MLGVLDQDEIEGVLRTERIGRVAAHAEHRTYIVPISYAYDGRSIYAHSAEGLKLRMMRANPEVCFEVEQVDSLDHWRSVIAWGTFEELHGPDAEQGNAPACAALPAARGERDSPAWPRRGDITPSDRCCDGSRGDVPDQPR